MVSSSSNSGPPGYCQYKPGVDPGATIVGGICYGDNMSTAGGPPEAIVGQDWVSDRVVEQVNWDADLTNGFDSDWVSVTLDVTTKSATLTVGNAPVSITYTGAEFDYIKKVQVSCTAVGGDRSFAWDAVVAKFYRNGTMVDADPVPTDCPMDANNAGGAPGAAGGQVYELTPTDADCDQVVVNALARMKAVGSTPPQPDDIRGQIYVFTTTEQS
jgi:hypothetical protein